MKTESKIAKLSGSWYRGDCLGQARISLESAAGLKTQKPENLNSKIFILG